MVTAHCGHHCTATATRGHDCTAHRIPNIHKGKWARGICRDTFYFGSLWANCCEIVANTTTLLHGKRCLFEHIKDTAHTIWDRPHNKTVEQSYTAFSTRTSSNPARRQKFEIRKRIKKFGFPSFRRFFNRSQSACNSIPAVFNCFINRSAIRLFKAVFHIPNLFGDRGSKGSHKPFHK